MKIAYLLRDKVSEHERLHIESSYYGWSTGNIEEARKVMQTWEQTYPRDAGAPNNLGNLDWAAEEYEKALELERQGLRLDPSRGLSYANVVAAYLYLNRLDEAQNTANEALQKGADSPYLRMYWYQLAFVKNDAAEMAQQVAWSAGKPGVEDVMLGYESDTAAYSGQLKKAAEVSARAVASAMSIDEKETAAAHEADAALWEAMCGNATAARQMAAGALNRSAGRDLEFASALALAISGDVAQSQKLADGLSAKFPEDSLVRFNYLPTIHAQIQLANHDATGAIETLKSTTPYELGVPFSGAFSPAAYPVYVRAAAYLAVKKGNEATAEFQKILDHRGIVQNEEIGVLSHLGLARAYVLTGEAAKARAAYQEFLTLWQNADAENVVLKEAKSEFAKLQ